MNMALPYSISCDLPAPLVFERGDGRFQLIDQTPVSPFMAGRGYLLVEKSFAEFLQQAEVEGVAFESAVLFSPATGAEFRSYVRVRVAQVLREHQLLDLNLSGKRMLALNDQHYFISPELKSVFPEGSFPYLSFGEGLSGFAASAA
jgi:hypothetical protein